MIMSLGARARSCGRLVGDVFLAAWACWYSLVLASTRYYTVVLVRTATDAGYILWRLIVSSCSQTLMGEVY